MHLQVCITDLRDHFRARLFVGTDIYGLFNYALCDALWWNHLDHLHNCLLNLGNGRAHDLVHRTILHALLWYDLHLIRDFLRDLLHREIQ